MTRSLGHRYTIGAWVRRDFRALVDELGLYATEHKGVFDSVFIVYGDDRARVTLARIVLDYAERQRAAEAEAAKPPPKREKRGWKLWPRRRTGARGAGRT